MRRKKVRKQISLLVPLTNDGGCREDVWYWLSWYWRHELPGVEIVIGRDKHHERRCKRRRKPFSKTTAVNDAFRRSHGDIVVILDADTYIPGRVIADAATRIRKARKAGVPLWFVPYRRIFRLTKEATLNVLRSNPRNPLRFSSPPPPEDVEDSSGSAYGHRYGALIQIMPREAFELVGCMDCRFRGWGGEDVAFLRALDTLYAPHKNMDEDVLHLWHPKLDAGQWQDPRGAWWEYRIWAGQDASRANDSLTMQYVAATGNVSAMRKLVDTGCRFCRKQRRPFPWR